uniref:Uncharacterized protein n=1 Tax=Rhizophora mucronata TaxID=61149 RepID=A0A2P2Q169_RHIMU
MEFLSKIPGLLFSHSVPSFAEL